MLLTGKAANAAGMKEILKSKEDPLVTPGNKRGVHASSGLDRAGFPPAAKQTVAYNASKANDSSNLKGIRESSTNFHEQYEHHGTKSSMSFDSKRISTKTHGNRTSTATDANTDVYWGDDVNDVDSLELTESQLRLRNMRRALIKDMNEHEHPIGCNRTCQNNFSAPFVTLAASEWYSNFMMFIIMLNVVTMMIESFKGLETLGFLPDIITSDSSSDVNWFVRYFSCPCNRREFMVNINYVFFVIYMVEFLVMCIGLGVSYFTLQWGIFDFVMLLVMIIEVVDVETSDCREFYAYRNYGYEVQKQAEGDTEQAEWVRQVAMMSDFLKALRSAKTLKVLKAFKAFRAFRIIKSFRVLRSLTAAIVYTLTNHLVHVIIVMFIFLLIGTVIGVHLFGGRLFLDIPNWRTFYDSFCNLLVIFTVDGYYDVFKTSATNARYGANPATYTGEIIILALFMLVVIVFLHFIIFNIFAGVNIIQIQEANDQYLDEIIEEKEIALAQKLEGIKRKQTQKIRILKERQHAHAAAGGGSGDFYEMTKDFRSNLRHDDYVIGDSPVTNLDWIELELDTFDIMDDQAYKLQQIYFEMAHVLCVKANDEYSKQVGRK